MRLQPMCCSGLPTPLFVRPSRTRCASGLSTRRRLSRPRPGDVSDLRELYQSVILDHNRKPRNYGPVDDAGGRAEGRNPLCGDNVTVWVKTEGDRVTDVGFVGEGCAISRASASIMTTVL